MNAWLWDMKFKAWCAWNAKKHLLAWWLSIHLVMEGCELEPCLTRKCPFSCLLFLLS